MSQVRFGELLGRLVNLSRHDVDEILEEQNANHQRFGEIALSWGLCAPEHIWQAWCDQLLEQVQKVDLVKLGVDSQAAGLIGGDLARKLNVIPIRCLGGQLVVAAAEHDHQHITAELHKITAMSLRFVTADADQIRAAISVYYAGSNAAAA
jgi:type IV pilus assembly protein PilB